jgi:hypothetical protein
LILLIAGFDRDAAADVDVNLIQVPPRHWAYTRFFYVLAHFLVFLRCLILQTIDVDRVIKRSPT